MPKQPRFWIGSFTRRRRPSDPWFDLKSRLAKRRVRQMEPVSRSGDVHSSAVTERTAERRAYRALLRKKREAFWTSTSSLRARYRDSSGDPLTH